MQGKTINGFTLKHLLGAGGMAEVWYAENKIGKKAAVKLLLPKLCQDENVTSRFLNEAKVMVQLDHPNIRQVYDYGEIDGRPTIVMEYLEGDDLKARMKRGQHFTEAELERWWNQLVDALTYTHKKGIVHRDLKPGNIFVDSEGNIKLLDFGIAKVRESISSTQTGQKLGTLMYMSPEQVKDSKHIDYHTDIYSLAVTFVHLLTGQKPYDSTTSSDYDIQVSIVTKPLDMSKVPQTWCSFLTPYLNKEPEQRPALRYFEALQPIEEHASVVVDEDEGTVVENVKQPETKPVAKPTPRSQSPKTDTQPVVKPQTKQVETESHPSEPNDQPKSKKGLWIGLIIALVAAIIVSVFLLSDNKDAETLYLEGKTYCDNGDYDKAIPLLTKAAEKDHSEAAFLLGFIYSEMGQVDQTFRWCRKAAELGNAEGQVTLGMLYQGDNNEEARKWFHKAADQGVAHAFYLLGELSEYQDEDYDEAMNWYKQAAERQDDKALDAIKALEKKMPEFTIAVNDASFVMKKVEGGSFKMGDNNPKVYGAQPAHNVTLSTYYIGETEVTQGLWKAVMGDFYSNSNWIEKHGVGSDFPAYGVNWNDCQTFIDRLNQLTGRNFRLPTEAEWEFAARGGNQSKGFNYAGSNNVDDVAWYWQNSGDHYLRETDIDWDSDWYGEDAMEKNHCRSHPVMTKSPNELGLYDMSGNVIEWCQDRYGKYSSGSQIDPKGASNVEYRVLRGGWWDGFPDFCQIPWRNNYGPEERHYFTGLRLALSE